MSQAGQFQFAPFAPSVETLTGNTGGAVPPTGGNINVVGTGSVSVAGNPGTSTLTISNSGAVAISFAGDSGTATPSSGVITMHGGNNITTSASGSTVTYNVSGTTNNAVQIGNSGGSLTSLTVGTNGQVLLGATGAAPAFAALTSTGGTISFTTGSNSLNLETAGKVADSFATDSGTATPSAGVITMHGGSNISTSGSGSTVTYNVSGTTNHAVQIGNSSGSLTSISVGATGTVLAGSTGADPSFTATPTVTSITFGAGSALSTYTAGGTFTPALNFGGGSTGITYLNRQGSYYQIGGILCFDLTIVLTSKGSSTGAATITGLPVSSAAAGTWVFTVGNISVGFPASTSQFYGVLAGASSTINLNACGSSVNSNVTDTQFSNTSQFTMSGFYFTA